MADEKLYLDFTGLSEYDSLSKKRMEDADAAVLAEAKKYTDEAPFDPAGTAATKVQELADGQVATNKADIAKLNGDATTEGSVAKAVADAKSELQNNIDAVEAKADKAQEEVDAVEVDLGNVDNLSTENKTVVGAINEVLTAVGTGGTAAVVTITTDTTTEGALKSYTIKQGTTTVGVIDIPKDMVVESGSVVVDPEGQEAGTYIKLVLANVADPLYINVGKLVDLYTAKADATQVQIAIDSATREISATIVAGSVTSTELADNAVITAKIADANVTKAKLSTEVQASLDKADAAVPQATYDAKVAELAQADTNNLATAKTYAEAQVAVEKERAEGIEAGLASRLAAVEGQLGEGDGEGTTVDEKIAAAKQEAIDAAAADATTKANQALADAKTHADEEDAKIEARVDALETDNTTNKANISALQDEVASFTAISSEQIQSLFTTTEA